MLDTRKSHHVISVVVAMTLAASAILLAATPALARSPHKARPRVVITDGVFTGTVRVLSGTPPFSAYMVTESGKRLVAHSTSRTFSVPLVAGTNTFQVKTADAETTATGIGNAQFWVADDTTRRLERYDAAADTMTVSTWVRGDDTTSAVVLRNVAVRPTDDHVFAVFSDNLDGTTRNRLIELAPDGSVVATIPVPGSYKVLDCTFDSAGNIYTSDRGTGGYADNHIRITKLSPAGVVLDSTQTVLPPSIIGYPAFNLYSTIEYSPIANKLVVRINTATFAVLDPDTLATEAYRFSSDTALCTSLNFNDASDVVLYTGGSGFNLPPFFAKESNFLIDPKYADSSIFATPSPDWEVTPTLAAITDIAVDANDFVYTAQHDAGTGFAAYVVDPDGLPVKTILLPRGTKLAIVR